MVQSQKETTNKHLDSIAQAQKNMRMGYANGSVGTLVSGIIWLVAATVAFQLSSQTAIWTLFFGGMLIHPLSVILCKLLGIPGKHSKGNPLGKLVMESTFFMLLCIPLALLLSLQNHAWFFQGMLLIIGGRYLLFSSLYGLRVYWLLGGLLAVSTFVLFSVKAESAVSAFTGSIIEVSFGIFMFVSFRKTL